MKNKIAKKIAELAKVQPSQVRVDCPKDEKFGDYTTNIALVLAPILKRKPMEIAEELIKRFDLSQPKRPKGVEPHNVFEKIEAVAPGYINFYLSKRYLQNRITEINEKMEKFGCLPEKKEKTMVEYSQPNTHKEFHIGHLRNIFIGSSLVETLKKTNHEVVSANYIGDTGSHIAKCLWAIQKFHAGENLDLLPYKAEFLGKAYAEAVQAIEQNQEYEKDFKELQNKFDQGNNELIELWQKTRQWSLDEFQSIYEMLGVKFDVYFYESEEEIEGKKLIPELLKKKIVEESEGAIVANLEKDNLGVLVLVRKDGSALYGLKDIPLAIKKFDKFGIENSIYIVDIRQGLYFKQIFKILEKYGFRKKMFHVGYEFVTLKDAGSMSSRKGNVISAKDLIDKVSKQVKLKFPESPDPVSIALGAIKFYMLKYSAGSKIEYDINESVKLEGATGPYVQYAHARICSILRKSEALNPKSETNSIHQLADKIQNSKLELLVHEKELSLIKELNKFPELIEEISQSYEVHKLPHYAVRLADKFHSFYDACRVIDDKNTELTKARLKLINAVRIVLAETLRLMGINAPERM